MRLRLTAVTKLQVREIDAWWRSHRDASDLFLDEFDRALGSLLAAPESGHLDDESKVVGTRTVRLPKTNYLVFYRLDADEIRVTSVWDASRGTRPDPDDLAREGEQPYVHVYEARILSSVKSWIDIARL